MSGYDPERRSAAIERDRVRALLETGAALAEALSQHLGALAEDKGRHRDDLVELRAKSALTLLETYLPSAELVTLLTALAGGAEVTGRLRALLEEGDRQLLGDDDGRLS